jgi:hypothetical protein
MPTKIYTLTLPQARAGVSGACPGLADLLDQPVEPKVFE